MPYPVRMIWSAIILNLLIGFLEGLEAGLVANILLAAARQAAAAVPDGGQGRGGHGGHARRMPSAGIWLGLLGAVMLSGSLAAVLTFSTDLLSSRAQEAVSGLLSVLAVGLVTSMIFWMRRTAASPTELPRSEVARATALGAGALTIIAFLAVGREGLQTTLFLWTTARASGQTPGPLAGAATGLAAAVVICCLLYRRVVKLNVEVFFKRAALTLSVIAAGVLAYGLGKLQGAALLPGQRWIAFDLTAHAHPGAWWVALITGVTDLSPRMTVLQVVIWIAYLAVVIPAFAKAYIPAASRVAGAVTAGRWKRLAARRPWAVAGVLVAMPTLAAGTTIALLPAASSSSTATVTVTRTACAPGWTSATAGTHTFTVDNESGLPGEINLDDSSGDILAEIETIGPGTSAQLAAILGSGIYVFKCYMGSQPAMASAPVQVISAGNTAAASLAAASPAAASPIPVKQVTVGELAGPNKQYQAYAARQLADLAQEVTRIRADLRQRDMAAAREDWLTAQLAWEGVGASYDSFGQLGLAVDGLPGGLPDGVSDGHFTGLHRLEYGLWHGQSAATLLPVAATLASNVAVVQQNLTSQDLAGDPQNLPVRVHEILEDALRDHLSGLDDQGASAAFAETYADVQVTRAVLGYLAPLIDARQPGLPDIADGQLEILQQALLATRVHGQWGSLGAASLTARENVDAAIDAVLETLAAVPDLLEVPPAH